MNREPTMFDLAAILEHEARILNRIYAAAHGGPPLYVASAAAPAHLQPCRCGLYAQPHQRTTKCEPA